MPSTDINVSAERLRDILTARFGNLCVLYADLFALGCLLHRQGEIRAGLKLVNEVLHLVIEPGTKTYLVSVRESLPGNELRFAREMHAHLEVNELFDRMESLTGMRDS